MHLLSRNRFHTSCNAVTRRHLEKGSTVPAITFFNNNDRHIPKQSCSSDNAINKNDCEGDEDNPCAGYGVIVRGDESSVDDIVPQDTIKFNGGFLSDVLVGTGEVFQLDTIREQDGNSIWSILSGNGVVFSGTGDTIKHVITHTECLVNDIGTGIIKDINDLDYFYLHFGDQNEDNEEDETHDISTWGTRQAYSKTLYRLGNGQKNCSFTVRDNLLRFAHAPNTDELVLGVEMGYRNDVVTHLLREKLHLEQPTFAAVYPFYQAYMQYQESTTTALKTQAIESIQELAQTSPHQRTKLLATSFLVGQRLQEYKFVPQPIITTNVAKRHDNRSIATILPNPATHTATIYTTSDVESTNSSCILLDITGKQIRQLRLHGQSTLIDISDLPNGMYFYQIKQGQEIIQTDKLMIVNQ